MKNYFKIVSFLVLIVCAGMKISNAQDLEKWVQKNPYSLPIWMTPEEEANSHLIGKGFVASAPPTGEVRNVAEFDHMQGVVVRYPFGIPFDLIASLSEDIIVYTVVANQSEQNTVTSQYNNNSVNMNNVVFVTAPSNSYWTRDYGPWFVNVNDNEVAIVDFIYNRPRPDDDNIPVVMANMLGIPYYSMSVEHCGGNYMCDGMGIAVSTDLVLEENSYTQTQLNQIMNEYLGIENYHITMDPLDDYIKHVDCWGKFLDVDKILIGQVPSSDYRYEDYEEVADYFANSISSYGTPYQVFRVYAPGDYPYTPYTNSLIANNKVFVPQTGSEFDDEALAVYEEAMPGYEIIGIYDSDWMNTDALHCRVMGIADIEVLQITHVPYSGIQPILDNYSVSAQIIPYSGTALIPNEVKVMYKVNGGAYNSVVMNHIEGNTYTALIPGQEDGDVVAYYITASDESGRTQTHPYIGEADPHTFTVGTPLLPVLHISQTAVNETAEVEQTATETITLSNVGTGSLYFSLAFDNAPWLSISIAEGTLNQSESADVVLTFNAEGIAAGTYTCNLIVTDDISKNETIVPVTFVVTPGVGIAEMQAAELLNCYPNPTTGATTIVFNMNKNTKAKLEIYNSSGILIQTVFNEELTAGMYRITWNGTNANGALLSNGIYFYRLSTSDFTETKSIILNR